MGYYNNESLSRGEYFSWINHTSEGSTEKQTLIHLNYFRFMHQRFGLEWDIYAFDAGNPDGASGTYGSMEAPRFRENFPEGFGAVAKAVEKAGMRMGLWAGADGFGDTPEEEARKEVFISISSNSIPYAENCAGKSRRLLFPCCRNAGNTPPIHHAQSTQLIGKSGGCRHHLPWHDSADLKAFIPPKFPLPGRRISWNSSLCPSLKSVRRSGRSAG